MSSREAAISIPGFPARAGLVLDVYLSGDEKLIKELEDGLLKARTTLRQTVGQEGVIDQVGNKVLTELDEVDLHISTLQGILTDDYVAVAK